MTRALCGESFFWISLFRQAVVVLFVRIYVKDLDHYILTLDQLLLPPHLRIFLNANMNNTFYSTKPPSQGTAFQTAFGTAFQTKTAFQSFQTA